MKALSPSLVIVFAILGYVAGRSDRNRDYTGLEQRHRTLQQQFSSTTDALESLHRNADLRDEREALRKKTVSRSITELYKAVEPVGKLVAVYGSRSVDAMTDEERTALILAIQRLCRDVTDTGLRLRAVIE